MIQQIYQFGILPLLITIASVIVAGLVTFGVCAAKYGKDKYSSAVMIVVVVGAAAGGILANIVMMFVIGWQVLILPLALLALVILIFVVSNTKDIKSSLLGNVSSTKQPSTIKP